MVALCAAPFLLDDPKTPELFPVDAIERARKLVASFGKVRTQWSPTHNMLHVQFTVPTFRQQGRQLHIGCSWLILPFGAYMFTLLALDLLDLRETSSVTRAWFSHSGNMGLTLFLQRLVSV